MDARLAQIAAGDFSRRVDVPNRDELGVLAANLNRMSDELGRLYGELEAASRHKSEFLANMSHELRTPLNAIIGFSEVLEERMFGELNDKQAEYIRVILTSGRHLLSLINDILDLSKVEAGRMELELGTFNLRMALENALTLVRERATRHGLALDLTVDETLEDLVADERKFKQVLLNLLSNAVKFTPEGGRIDVRALPANGNSKCPSATPASASRRRTRKPSSRNSARWATPRASARARDSASRWRGSSSSCTAAASGSRARRVADRRSRSRFRRGPMPGELILLVEDNDNNRLLIRDVLQASGYRLVEAENAEDGLRMAAEQQPALILMDIQLPGMNGIEALQRLRADPATRAIPVIAVTASAMTQDRRQIMAAGFDGYQAKPISVKGFLQTIREMLPST